MLCLILMVMVSLIFLVLLVVVELSSGSFVSDAVVLCAFWHEWRVHFGVRVCDNLVGGVPVCVVAGFYPDSPVALYRSVEHWVSGVRVVGSGICRHFCRSDIISVFALVPSVVKRGCFFGGMECVHSDIVGFGACVGLCVRSSCVVGSDVKVFSVCVGCSRFVRV
jgi:hypothetical protein